MRYVHMRIAQVAPLAESVPPSLYGGTERVVSWLTEELVALGHDVTLFASGESKSNGKLIPVWPKALRLSRRFKDPFAGYAALMEAVAQSADQFDLIHCHSDWIHLPVLKRTGVPLVTTFGVMRRASAPASSSRRQTGSALMAGISSINPSRRSLPMVFLAAPPLRSDASSIAPSGLLCGGGQQHELRIGEFVR